MHEELTNLLPPERTSALARGYFMRLGVLIIWFVTALIATAMVLLLPTYVFLASSARSKEAHLASIESTLAATNETALAARVSALSANAEALSTLAKTPSASGVVRAALAISRPGIALSSFTFTAASGKNQSTLAVSGVAATRDALRNYQLALQGAPFARSANLPVSSYAKDSDITFIITITLAP